MRSSISRASRSRTGCGPRRKRHRILASRLRMTGNVVRLIRRLTHKPGVLVNASAIGWYGARGDEMLTEAENGRPSFGNSVCGDWERAAVQAERFGVRVVRLRIGLVLGTDGRHAGATCWRRSNTVSAARSVRERNGCPGSSVTTWCG